VYWPKRDDAQYEQVKRALGEIEFGWGRHAYYFYIYTRDV
jgi:hypothetical protein